MNPDRLVIALANRKGGTGKTTTAVNLSAEWGNQGYRTLLIDLDTQGHAAIGVGCRETRQLSGAVHQLYQNPELSLMEIVQPTVLENVWLAPADTDFQQQELNVHRLRSAIEKIDPDEQFQRIVIDTPPTLDGLLISGLVAAQGVVVPFVPHHLAEVGTRQLAKLFYQVSSRHNPDLKLLGLLPIMYDRHIKLHQRVVSGIEKQFGKDRMLRGIRNNIKVAEAFEKGLPICTYAPRSAGNMDYHLMALELESFLVLDRG
ncbi:MAG: ParA family protein [Candidatus Zixiibacteriota bacterium]|nr:MAG: ParA family protein [candidate division Zixibacteria bacterium]